MYDQTLVLRLMDRNLLSINNDINVPTTVKFESSLPLMMMKPRVYCCQEFGLKLE